MTREEAIKILKYNSNVIHRTINGETDPNEVEALDMAIEELQKEPCEDAISREDALMALTGEWTELTDEIIHRFIKRIKGLPPVTPQPKMGNWVTRKDEYGDVYEAVCSCCGINGNHKWTYCPNCGQPKMQEVKK